MERKKEGRGDGRREREREREGERERGLSTSLNSAFSEFYTNNHNLKTGQSGGNLVAGI